MIQWHRSDHCSSLLLLLLLICFSTTVLSQECQSLVRCSDCITRNVSCAWCNDERVFTALASDVTLQLQPATLCRTPDELTALGCANIINPQGMLRQEEARDGDQNPAISPQLINLSLRPDVPKNLTVTVRPPQSISVDMYILMDLSFTMRDDLQSLRSFADELVEQMQNLTDEFRIGFGSFIEKPVVPFVDARNPDFPCAGEYPAIQPEQCGPVYDFQHQLDFTDEADLFIDQLANANISSSLDEPESLLDALLQIAVCPGRISWRDIGDARRLVLVLTNGDYHYALDGRVAGLRAQPDKVCRLNSDGQYEYATKVDYPSSAFIADLLNEQRIIPIFAVENTVRTVFDQLSQIIRSAFVGEISSNSDNLLELISTQYRRLSTTVVPVINGLGNLPELNMDTTVIDNCTGGILQAGTDDTCIEVIHPNSVSYQFTFSLSPDYCLRGAESRGVHQLEILFIGFGDVQINISGICSCDCSNELVQNSPTCSNVGTYECSTCICPDTYSGAQCQCSASIAASAGCIPSGSNANQTEVCSNRGTCTCNGCECDLVPELNTGQRYQGQYCECNPFSCPSGVNTDSQRVLPCAGHGTCGCDTQCICDPGYSGVNCECTNSTSTCIAPADTDTGVLCSGVGQCACGTCLCDDYSVRFGIHCEECRVCVRSCSLLSDCVRCYVEENCDSSCSHVNITNQPVAAASNQTNEVLRSCSISRDSCEVVYQVNLYVLGTEDNIVVIVDPDQLGLTNWNQGCDNTLQIWIIPLVITLAIIIIAIIILALWKGIAYFLEYLEYRAWRKSQESELWNTSGENPLFVDPTTSHINPKYRTRPVNIQSD